MATEFKLPDLGENVEAGEVINLLVSVGDSLEEDQPVIELETDKAVIEVPSSVSGTIAEIMVSEGDTAAVGQVILTVEGSVGGPGQKPEAPARQDETPAREVEAAQPPVPRQPPSPAGEAAASRPPVEVKLPALGEGIESGDIVAVLVSPGSDIAVDDPVLEIEIDKGVVEMPSPLAGKVTAVHVSEGDKAAVGQLVLTLESDAPAPGSGPAEPPPAHAEKEGPQQPAPAAPPPAPVPAPAPPAGTDTPAPTKLVPAAPSVRRLAREIGIDIAEVRGTGPGGRISADDVKTHSRAINSGRAAAPGAAGTQAEAAPLPDFSKWGDVERKPMSNVRRVTARHMANVWGTIPHVTQFDRADVTDLEAWRRKYGKTVEAAGGKLTPTAIAMKVAAAGLSKFPAFNASIDAGSEEVIYKKYINIGVAVDTERGLLVPVVRDVDRKDILELSVELTEISARARSGKLGIEEMQGGTFTISNLGGIGGTSFTPLVNAPEVAILGIARSSHQPVLVDGEFAPRLMMPLALSYDHRLIDGADGARFLRWFCDALENPFLLALGG